MRKELSARDEAIRSAQEEARDAGARLAQVSDSMGDAQRREQKRLTDLIESLRAELAATNKQLDEANVKVDSCSVQLFAVTIQR